MVVVGGFAASPYLMERIKHRFSRLVPQIISPPNPGSAVCQGAVALALHPNAVDSRICKKTYGFHAVEPFVHGVDPPQFGQYYDGVLKCNNRSVLIYLNLPVFSNSFRLSKMTDIGENLEMVSHGGL